LMTNFASDLVSLFQQNGCICVATEREKT